MICYILAVRKNVLLRYSYGFYQRSVHQWARLILSFWCVFFPWNKTPEQIWLGFVITVNLMQGKPTPVLEPWVKVPAFSHCKENNIKIYLKCNSWANNIAYLDMCIYISMYGILERFLSPIARSDLDSHTKPPFPSNHIEALAATAAWGTKRSTKQQHVYRPPWNTGLLTCTSQDIQPNCFDMYCGCIFHAVMRCVHDHLKQSVLLRSSPRPQRFCLLHGHC